MRAQGWFQAPWFKSIWLRLAIAVIVLAEAALWGWNSYSHLPILGVPIGLPLAIVTRSSGTRHPPTWPAIVVDQNGVLSVFSTHAPEAEAARTRPKPGEEVRAEVWCWPMSRTYGLAAPALVSCDHTVRIVTTGSVGFTTQEYASIRGQYASMVAAEWNRWSDPSSPYPRLLALGDGTSVRVRPWWLVHDLFVFGLILAAFASWYHGSFKPARARRRLERNTATLSAGLCPSCRYSIASLSTGPDAKCPECGRALSP